VAVIEVEELTRRYRSRTGTFRRRTAIVEALQGVSFAVERGELFGLLGPNGAGKTTMIKVLTTLLLPSSGSARVLGFDVRRQARQIRGKVGYVFGGDRGLDPVGARDLRDTICGLHQAGKTILLTTHYMYEADALCQRIAVIANGSFVATGTPSDLKQVVGDNTIVEIETFGVPDEATERLRRVPGVRAVGVETRDQAQVLLVQSAAGADIVRALLNELAGAVTGKVITREPTLEDAYVELVRTA